MSIHTTPRPASNVIVLDAKTGPAFMSGLAFGHYVDQAEARLRQSWGYYRARQYAARRGWSAAVHGSVDAWRPKVRAAVAQVRAARVKAGVA